MAANRKPPSRVKEEEPPKKRGPGRPRKPDSELKRPRAKKKTAWQIRVAKMDAEIAARRVEREARKAEKEAKKAEQEARKAEQEAKKAAQKAEKVAMADARIRRMSQQEVLTIARDVAMEEDDDPEIYIPSHSDEQQAADILGYAQKHLEEIEAELAKRSLVEFIQQFWKYIDPAEYIHGWHLEAICDHLEAVTNGDIRNLLITMPPRHMKSISVSVCWPAWTWLRMPKRQFLFASYAHTLSIRDSVKCRRLIESPLYRKRWGHLFQMVVDQNTKIRFDNTEGGYRMATSVGGALTGEGGDIIVVDDPHNVEEVESDTVRENAIRWFDESMSTRLNNPKTGARVVIQQRVHQYDLAGHLIETGQWEHLNLPAEFEPKFRCFTAIRWTDPRSREGELLWPNRFPRSEIDRLKRDLGAYAYAAQFQQIPVPRGGGLFNPDKFHILERMPAREQIEKAIRYWDKAGTEGGGAFTVGNLMVKLVDGEFPFQYAILDVVRGQWATNVRNRLIVAVAKKDFGRCRPEIWIEQEPGSSGKEAAEHNIKELVGFVAKADRVTGDKEVRADPYSSQVNIGNVAIVRAPWNREFLEEHRYFPKSKFKDQVDAASGAFSKLHKRGRIGVF